MPIMQKTIHQRIGDRWIADQFVPLAYRQLADNDCASSPLCQGSCRLIFQQRV